MKRTSQYLMKEFKNKQILVTGGSGSIGVAIVKKLLYCKPKGIRILTNDENSIFECKKILGNNPMLTYIIGDIREKDRMVMAMKNIDIVFHAAAMKHIDICEENPFDAVKTNVVGTSNVLEAALIENISKFILISTDKATNPSSTLGASKLLAEKLTKNASAYRGIGKTIFAIVRFGNVIGSRGSVFQIFVNQILHKKTITITDLKMTRFIMSMSDAADLILKITNIAKDGEIFIMKMPSVKIIELAKAISKVLEKRTKEKVSSKINVSNARHGERIREHLITEEEIPYCYDMDDMYKISNKVNSKKINLKIFNSETATQISKKDLEKTIIELLDEY